MSARVRKIEYLFCTLPKSQEIVLRAFFLLGSLWFPPSLTSFNWINEQVQPGRRNIYFLGTSYFAEGLIVAVTWSWSRFYNKKGGKEIRRLSSFQSVPDVCMNGYRWMNEPSHSAPLSSLTRNKRSGKVASQHETGGLRNTYIREDLKLCTHGSPQDRTAYSTMSVLDSLCALCWMDLCDGTVEFPQHAVGYIVQYAMVKPFWCMSLSFNNKNPVAGRRAYFHMLCIPFDLWNDMSSFIIHMGCGIITISPSGLRLTP